MSDQKETCETCRFNNNLFGAFVCQICVDFDEWEGELEELYEKSTNDIEGE